MKEKAYPNQHLEIMGWGKGREVSCLMHDLTLTKRAEDYHTDLNKRPKSEEFLTHSSLGILE